MAFAVRYNNYLALKHITTFAPLLMVSAQLINIPFFQNEFAANAGKF